MSFLALSPASSVLILLLLSDTVVLKNGNEIQGEIVQESAERVVLKFPGGVLELPQKNIAEVRHQRRIDYLLDEGEKQMRRRSFQDAVATFREAIRESPTSTPAQQGLIDAQGRLAAWLRDLGRYDEAREAFRAIIEIEPATRPKVEEELRTIERTLEDARREEERGLKELAGGSLEEGTWRLQRIHERFPARRKELAPIIGRALIQQGNSILGSGDWAQAESRYAQALVLDPELHPLVERPFVEARRHQIEPLLQGGDFASAEKLVLTGLEVSPTSEVLRYYHGLCLEARGKKRDAAEEYASITGGRRPPNMEKAVRELRIAVENRLMDDGKVAPTAKPSAREVLQGDFRKLVTEHFVILHKNEEVARDVALVAERSYGTIFKELGCVAHPKSPLEITVFPTREEYLRATGQESWASGSHLVSRRMGVLSEHRIHSYQNQPCLNSAILRTEIRRRNVIMAGAL